MKKLMTILVALAVVAFSFAGCSEKSQAETKEKRLVAGATTGFFGAESLDVAHNWDGWIMSIYGISENLFRLDENYTPQPWIAESYKQTDDLTWNFTIRDNVTFSNGNKVTAQAVKECFERTYQENSRASSTLAIDEMTAQGQVLTIKTSSPAPTILNDLCDPLLGIYDINNIDDTLGVSCTGAYVATAFTPMAEITMTKNENYWGGEPKLDEIVLKVMDDQNALQMALQNGEIDMTAQLDSNGAKLFADNDNYTVKGVTSSRSDFLMFNLKSQGIDDIAVRQAIGYCIDRENFASVVYNGYATPSYAVYPETLSFGDTSKMNFTVDSYDLEKAKEILKEAGYADTDNDSILEKDGKELSFKVITYSYNSASIQLCDMLQSTLSQIGIIIETETYDVLDDYLQKGDFDIAVLSYAMAPIGTPQYFTNMIFTTDASNNYMSYSNNTVDTLATKLNSEFDTQKQAELTKEICQEIINDRPIDVVAHQQFVCVWRNGVTGVSVNPSEYYFITSQIDIEG